MSLHFRNGNLKFEKGMCQHKVAKKLFQFSKKKKKLYFFLKKKGKKMMSILLFSPKICSYFTFLALQSQHIINVYLHTRM